MAQQFPASHITAISNSASQRAHIVRLAADRGLRNLDVLTRDINHFDTESKFDRIVSVEMFEHLRNYGEIFGRISNWLNEEGQFFMHIFCHRNQPYEFIDRGPGDWMTRYFFAGGIMPSVGQKKFPYTSSGVAQAQKHARATGQKMQMKKGGKVNVRVQVSAHAGP